MRVVFAGTPRIAVPSLDRLWQNPLHEVVAVVTMPDRRGGRGNRVITSPVKARALELGVPLLQPDLNNPESWGEVVAHTPSLLVAAAYGGYFKSGFLELFPGGGINMHPSLLPRYRGSSPIPSAILNGDSSTGVTIQQITARLDGGGILAQREHPLDGTETTEQLFETLGEIGAIMTSEVVDRMQEATIHPTPQDETFASYCGKISREDGEISWRESAVEIDRRLRAYTPWPGIYTYYRGVRLNILEAGAYGTIQPTADSPPGRVIGIEESRGILIQTGCGSLAVTRLQLQSRRAIGWREFCNGTNSFVGSELGEIV